jgi:microcystin-dependent protein
MSTPFVGQILAVAFPFTPVGWLPCSGGLYPISQYQALFQLIGTTYGGDGVSNFAVPNLAGRTLINIGQGQGLSPYVPGQVVGSEQVTLTANQTVAHTHSLIFSTSGGSTNNPTSGYAVGAANTTQVNVYTSGTANSALNAGSIVPGGGGNQPHENRQPYLTINYIIAYQGVYPTQG